jgi:hypothetical protein
MDSRHKKPADLRKKKSNASAKKKRKMSLEASGIIFTRSSPQRMAAESWAYAARAL